MAEQTPLTIHGYRAACVAAVQAAVAAAEEKDAPPSPWAGLTVYADQLYQLRGPGGGIAGPESLGTLNLALDMERGGEWAGGIPEFPGFGLYAEMFLPVIPASGVQVKDTDWAAAESRIAQLTALLRGLLENIHSTAGLADWEVDYDAGSVEGGPPCVGARIRWRSTEG